MPRLAIVLRWPERLRRSTIGGHVVRHGVTMVTSDDLMTVGDDAVVVFGSESEGVAEAARA
jgi:hypothetical protein